MRELKILAVLIGFTAVLYWGVEPYAHSVMHPHVEEASYEFSDCDTVASGNVANGKELVTQNCIACHSITKEGFDAPLDNATASASYGVVPPDLSAVGAIYNANFLGAFIENPAKATMTEHKFGADKAHPMPGYDWLGKEGVADIVAYLKSIAPLDMSNKEVFEEACARCHSLKYAGIEALTTEADIKSYMGSMPPDLSMMIRSRKAHYLHTFINEPQKLLPGTAMPRVGLTEEAEAQVVKYLEQIGDSKKAEREELGVNVIIYMLIFTVLAYLWYKRRWSDLH
jgi:ubiquinol-cytochrome c reductase cytochrome c1 subunit